MLSMLHRWILALLLMTWMVMAVFAQAAQETSNQKKEPPAQEKKDETKNLTEDPITILPYWVTDRSFQIRAAVTMLGARDPWQALANRMAISESVPTIPGWDFVFDKVFPLQRRYLDAIQDERTLPNLQAKLIKELKPPDQAFYLAYIQALQRSYDSTREQFENSAEEYKNVVYTHLVSDPRQYRGKIITVQGKLVLVRSRDAPEMVQELDQEGKRRTVYWGYILGPTKKAPPFTAIFTELPKELSVSENLNAEVTFHGYFLANIRFPADKARGVTQKDIISPYLVGKTMSVNKPMIDPPVSKNDTPYAYDLIVAALATIVVIILLGAGLNVWFRRGDRKIHSQLAEVRDKHHPFRLEPDSEPTEQPVQSTTDPNDPLGAKPTNRQNGTPASQPTNDSPPPASPPPAP